jgi:localization factor PodJL
MSEFTFTRVPIRQQPRQSQRPRRAIDQRQGIEMSNQAYNENYGARADAAGIASNEPSQTGMLDQMRDRLASLSDEARSIRSQVPHEFEPDIVRIQAQMQRLGERLHDLGRGALVPYKTTQQDSAPQVKTIRYVT